MEMVPEKSQNKETRLLNIIREAVKSIDFEYNYYALFFHNFTLCDEGTTKLYPLSRLHI